MAREKLRGRVLSPNNEEQECIALAYKQARKALENGTAPTSIVKHFLEMGSPSHQVIAEIKQAELDLLQAKADQIKDGSSEKQAYLDAMAAIKSYEYRGTS